MKTVITSIILIFMIACQQGNSRQEKSSDATDDAVIRKETLNIGKMHCEMCVASIEKGLLSVEGVEHVKASLEDSAAVVQYDESKTNIAEMRKIIEQRGYTLKDK